MIVTEYEGKRLLRRMGVPTPRGYLAHTPAEAAARLQELAGAGVVKALIPAGGRGQAGGVRLCPTPGAARDATAALLGHELLGHIVRELLVEEAVSPRQEIYAGVLANTASGRIELVVSLAGGVEVEAAASVLRLEVEPGEIVPAHRLARWLVQEGTGTVDSQALAETLAGLYRAAADLDALLLEVNPLALTEAGSLMALDCKLEVDDNALPCQPDLLALHCASLSVRERRARGLGISFVPLEGNIGVIASGAGLGMATIDMLKRAGLAPAGFLDTGGGISEALVKGALELVMEPPEVKGVLINLYGGINRMLEAARGIAAALAGLPGGRPIVVKILGNQQEEAWAMLEELPDVHVVRVVQTEVAVAKLAALVR